MRVLGRDRGTVEGLGWPPMMYGHASHASKTGRETDNIKPRIRADFVASATKFASRNWRFSNGNLPYRAAAGADFVYLQNIFAVARSKSRRYQGTKMRCYGRSLPRTRVDFRGKSGILRSSRSIFWLDSAMPATQFGRDGNSVRL